MPKTLIQQGRGELTAFVKKKSKELLGYEIGLRELRLMPYIQYVMVNEQKLDTNKVNAEERTILRSWKDKGYIKGGASGLQITKDFWDSICEIIFAAYVDID